MKDIPDEERALILQGGGSVHMRPGPLPRHTLIKFRDDERKHTEHETSKKFFDFSSNTIKQLVQNGYDDVVEFINASFGHEYGKSAGMKQGDLAHHP